MKRAEIITALFKMSAISQHFENDAFCNDLLVACYTDIERELKGERIP